jgi:hypothetical protein
MRASSDQQVPPSRPILLGVRGMLLGLLPLLLFLLPNVCFFLLLRAGVSLIPYSDSPSCGLLGLPGPPPPSGVRKIFLLLNWIAGLSFPLYAIELVGAVIVAIGNGLFWKSKKISIFTPYLLAALVLDVILFWYICLYVSLKVCGGLVGFV